MTLLYNKAKHLPGEKSPAEVRAMIETYNTKADFVDHHALTPLWERIRQKLSAGAQTQGGISVASVRIFWPISFLSFSSVVRIHRCRRRACMLCGGKNN